MVINKWEIYFMDLNPTQGSEQRGTRPVLVASNDAVNHNLPVFTCIPFSSVKPGAKIYPTEIYVPQALSGLPKDSVLMLQQIRTVSPDRIVGPKCGTIADPDLREQIKHALIQYFELD